VRRFTRQGVIEAQPHQVFDFVADQSRLPLWCPEVASSAVAGGGPIDVGARLVRKRRSGWRTVTTEAEVVVHDRPRTHAVRSRMWGVELVHTFSLWPEGRGTRVTFECVCDGKGLGKLFEGVAARAMEKDGDQRIQRLKNAMEKGRRGSK
jgi:hypothetical protein